MITVEQLDHFVKKYLAELYCAPLNETVARFNISGIALIHFLSQLLHESLCFIYVEEIADGSKYEGRKDLGNTQAGDGRRYKGRGLIQITGRANYQALSDYFEVDFINKPELLELPKWACLSAGWFWHTRGLNKLTTLPEDKAVIEITKRINGGTNGLKDRQDKFKLVKSILT